jgi:hypothetical protein
VDLSYVQRLSPDEAAWTVTLPEERGGEQALFRDADAGGVLPALLEALGWRDTRTGARKDWGWVDEGLERVDRGGTHGWWASVNLGTHLDADLFEDLDHGGPREALLAALTWRKRVGRGGGGSGNGGRGGGSGGGGRRGGEKEKRAAGPPREGQPARRGARKRPRRPHPRPPS